MSRKSSYNYSIRQFPSVQNQYTAIVSVSLSANNVSLSNYGIANPSTADTCNAVTIINAARADAQEQIKKQIRYIISNPIDEEHRDVAKIVQENSDAIALPPAKSKNIGDDEMADTGQKDYVIDLAEEKKVHAGHLCEEMFDYEFDKATVGEVNEMIRVLNRV